jgi:hypothetical protein
VDDFLLWRSLPVQPDWHEVAWGYHAIGKGNFACWLAVCGDRRNQITMTSDNALFTAHPVSTRWSTSRAASLDFLERGERKKSNYMRVFEKEFESALPLPRRQQGVKSPWGRQKFKGLQESFL